jgi:hypothetical protein
LKCAINNQLKRKRRYFKNGWNLLEKISSFAFITNILFKELLKLCPEQKTPEEKLKFQQHIAFQQMHQKCLECEITKTIEQIENYKFDWKEDISVDDDDWRDYNDDSDDCANEDDGDSQNGFDTGYD